MDPERHQTEKMGHTITAILLKGQYNKAIAEEFDLHGVKLSDDITMFYIDFYFSAYWQAKLGVQGHLETNGVAHYRLPFENVLAELMAKVSQTHPVTFALIATNYFGGIGSQYANVYKERMLADENIKTINQALSYLGVKKGTDLDEFDTIGLSQYRSNPEYLDKYTDLADELGV